MAAERSAIGHDDAAAELAVMRHVRVGHEQIVAADARHAFVMRRAAIDGA